MANSPTGSTEGKPEVEGGRIGVDRTEKLPLPWVDHCVQVCFINALVAIRAPNLLQVCTSVYHQSIEYSLEKILSGTICSLHHIALRRRRRHGHWHSLITASGTIGAPKYKAVLPLLRFLTLPHLLCTFPFLGCAELSRQARRRRIEHARKTQKRSCVRGRLRWQLGAHWLGGIRPIFSLDAGDRAS